MPLSEDVRQSLSAKLATLYGERADEALAGIEALADRYDLPARGEQLWDETDAVLITYGDMVRPDAADGSAEENGHALPAQTRWLLDHELDGPLSGCISSRTFRIAATTGSASLIIGRSIRTSATGTTSRRWANTSISPSTMC